MTMRVRRWHSVWMMLVLAVAGQGGCSNAPSGGKAATGDAATSETADSESADSGEGYAPETVGRIGMTCMDLTNPFFKLIGPPTGHVPDK